MSALWELVSSHDDLDPRALAAALRDQCQASLDDPRTLQLAYECSLALRPWNVQIPEIPKAYEPVGKFPSLGRRIALVTTAENILGFLREISLRLTVDTKIVIGGSSALILDRLLQRVTHDIDLVDEVPEAVRQLRAELERAQGIFNLHLAHFQSHYLPEGWQTRLVSLPPLRRLQVWRVCSLDIYVGKLFSRREKDGRDLVSLCPVFPRAIVEEHLALFAGKLLADQPLRRHIEDNWYVLYGDDLPVGPADGP